MSRIQKFRNSRRYQRVIQLVKWSVLPDWIFGPLIVFVLFWLGLATYAQARLPFLENSERLCRSSSGDIAEVAATRADFRTRDVCSASLGRVVETQRYIVTFDVVDPWYDSSVATTPEGIGVGDFPWGVGYLAAPFRRVVDARYLQPVVEVRPTDGSRRLFSRNIQIYPLSVRPVGDSKTLYRAEFVAPRTGELFLFANDAMVPLTARWWGTYGYRHFYEASGFGDQQARGNRGSACVTVERANVADVSLGAPPAGSACERAATRDAAQVETTHE